MIKMGLFKKEDYEKNNKKSSGSKPRWQVKRRIATQDKTKKLWCRNCFNRVKENIVCSQCGITNAQPLKTKPKGAE